MNNRDEIKQELIGLGFNVKRKYIRMGNYDYLRIYCKKHNSTISRVERTMRFAIEPAIKNIQEKYRYYYKINTSKFLNLIRIQMI